jgi:hypothetical protein
MLAVVGFYYLFSARGFIGGDHGGAFVLGVAVLSSMWAAARRSPPWIWTSILAVVFIIAVFLLAKVAPHERLDIAWGGAEGAGRYFDAAVNLRTGRDLARSGGFWGLYEALYVPSSLGNNYYNDLAAAYVAGFFGLVGLALVFLVFYIVYTRLFAGLIALRKTDSETDGADTKRKDLRIPTEMPSLFELKSSASPPDQSDQGVPQVWTSYGIAIVLVFLFQLLWVSAATLCRFIPFSGLDLQPISASVISILGFMVLLLGSVAWVHNVSSNRPGNGG